MNKIIKYLKNIMLVVIFSFTIYFIYNFTSFTINPINTTSFILYVITLLLLITFEIKKIKHKDPIANDLKYNSIFLLVEVLIIFLFIRNYTDPNLFVTPMDAMGEMNTVIYYGSRSYFILNNLIYINIMNICLITYYFINKQVKTKK